MTRRSIVGIALMLLTLASVVRAQEIAVTGRLVRPVWYDNVGAQLRDDQMLTNPDTIAASFQAVQFYQPGAFHPIYCGTALTDVTGTFSATAVCGGNPPTELYVEVLGMSGRGFLVGTFDEDGFYASLISSIGFAAVAALVSGALAPVAGGASVWLLTEVMKRLDGPPEIFVWSFFNDRIALGPGQNSVDFGVLQIGGGSGNPSSNADWAAAVMEGVDFGYRHLNPLGFAPGAPPVPPAFSNWVINNPLFGPTTVWRTVHLNQPFRDASGTIIGWEHNMGALAHELGHVVYNIRHSDENHFLLNDGANYLRNHAECRAWSRYNAAFAHYEGYANAIGALIWRDHAIATGQPLAYLPLFGCGYRGLDDEGEVSDLYVQLYHATGNERTAPNLKNAEAVAFGADQLSLPALPFMLNLVSAAGPTSHTPLQFWITHLSNACQAVEAGAPLYCGSDRFRCWARTNVANPGELPPDFFTAPCTPGASQITNVATTPAGPTTTNVVTFTTVPHVDQYEVFTASGPPLPPGTPPVWSGTAPPTTGIALQPCQTHLLWVRTVNNFGTTPSDPFETTPLNAAGCLPGVSSVISVAPQPLAIMCTTLERVERIDERAPLQPGDEREQPERDMPGVHRPGDAEPDNQVPSLLSVLEDITELSWYRVEYTTDPDARSYQVLYSTQSGDPTPSATSWWNSNARVLSLEPGNTYFLRIRSRNDFGNVTGPEFAYGVPTGTSGCFDSGTASFRAYRRIPLPPP